MSGNYGIAIGKYLGVMQRITNGLMIMAEKTDQHFVPRMLLKRYSWDGLYVYLCSVRSNSEIRRVPYKPQCQKRYFYGKDKRIENELERIEGFINSKLNELVNGCIAPVMHLSGVGLNDDELRRSILSYIYIQYSRTQKAKDIVDAAVSRDFDSFKNANRKEAFDLLKNASESNAWGATDDQINNIIDIHVAKLKDPFDHIFSVAYEQYEKNAHLKGVLLFNVSKIPFITSDNPVVNIVSMFSERVSSFFMPVSPAHCLFFFDERYFSVENIENVVYIYDVNEIAYVNSMQRENCKNNVYLPRMFSCSMLREVLGDNSHGGAFFNHIKAISLRMPYNGRIFIPIDGHAG